MEDERKEQRERERKRERGGEKERDVKLLMNVRSIDGYLSK